MVEFVADTKGVFQLSKTLFVIDAIIGIFLISIYTAIANIIAIRVDKLTHAIIVLIPNS